MLKRVLVIFLIITGAYISFNYVFDGNELNFTKAEDSAKVSRDVDKISIDIASVETEIIPDERDNVHAELKGKGTVSVKRKGDDIDVSVKRKGFFGFNWFEQDKTSLIVYIPEDFDRDLEIELGSGEVVFSGDSSGKPMKLDTLSLDIGSGNMELENIEANHLEHNSSSGKVVMDAVTTQTGSIKVSSGSVKVKKYSGKLDAEVSSGELELQLEELIDSVNINVSSGDVELDLPDHADFTLNGKASSGDISCDFPLKNEQESNSKISGKHGNGTHPIDVEVSSGDIDIF